ncbi:hypothetical protein [Streptomyces cucumeris]|uniref:hypothetical protein n=1 Tax=Streptomyces cucumeris TaxID=2962890 RepID=UPI0020C85101|nr:hypothetical protein [Streptomyces sp. NEAU-Y11]MCP9213515.1 hypothetical protein [Streptomyces sp. NEAU-Y11]
MGGIQSAAPGSPLELVGLALDEIAASVSLSVLPGPLSHTALRVSGIESPKVTRSLGRVLVGLLVGAVKCNVSLAAALLADGIDDQLQLAADVVELVGATNTFVTPEEILFRDTKRNAWLAEGLLHVLLTLQNREPAKLLGGRVHALRQIHPIPTQQGFDAVALYVNDDDALSLAIGESKASRQDGSGQLTQASKIFKSLDSGDHGRHLRQELTALEGYLSADHAQQVSKAVLNRRCYVPSIVHERPFDAQKERVTLRDLVPPLNRKRLLVIRLFDFHGFFDSVADAMRDAVTEIVV